VEINGQTINYGDHPKWVAERLFSAAGAGEETGEGDDTDAEGDA